MQVLHQISTVLCNFAKLKRGFVRGYQFHASVYTMSCSLLFAYVGPVVPGEIPCQVAAMDVP